MSHLGHPVCHGMLSSLLHALTMHHHLQPPTKTTTQEPELFGTSGSPVRAVQAGRASRIRTWSRRQPDKGPLVRTEVLEAASCWALLRNPLRCCWPQGSLLLLADGAFCCFILLRTVRAAKVIKRLEHLPYKKQAGRMKAWSGSYPRLSTLSGG